MLDQYGQRKRAAWTAALAAAAMIAAPTTITFAQQYAGEEGRALDASPQVGAGGVNQPEGQIDYRARNEIITGNVGGGRAFQDDVGYTAPGDFRDTLGSDDLFRFRRDSVRTAPGAPPARVTRPFTPMAPARPGEQVVVEERIDVGGFGLSPDGRMYDWTRPQRFDDQLGRMQDATAGRTLEVDPFRFDLTPRLEADEFWQRQLERDLGFNGFDPRPETLPDPTDEISLEDPREWRGIEDVYEDRTLRGRRILDQSAYRPSPEFDQDLPQQAGRLAPSLLLGQQLEGQLRGQPLDSDPAALQAFRQDLYRPLEEDEQAARGARDPYLDMLEGMRRRAQDQPWEPARFGRLPGEEEETDELTEIERRLAELEEQRRELEQREEAETDEQDLLGLTELERQRERELRELLGEDFDRDPDEREAQRQPWMLRDDEDEDEEAADALAELLEELRHDLPPLETLAGEDETQINAWMQQAEEALSGGDYFEAEELYRQVLRSQADHTLARVGMMHAQLGAGMIRSGVLTMRTLFEEHPELIAARYEDHLLPSRNRLNWLQRELQRMVDEDTEAAADPALMLAYLGYQTEARQTVRYGLSIAESRRPNDPLLPLLQHIWIEGGEIDHEELEAGELDEATEDHAPDGK